MTSQLELASHGHWLNWDLFSEKPLNKDEQDESLISIRNYIVKHIQTVGKKDHLYMLDLQLFPDIKNVQIYKLIANLSGMPTNGGLKVDDVRHNHDYYASGGETSLAVTGVPPPKPKGIDHIPFSRILVDLGEGIGRSALVNTGLMV